LQKNYTLGTHYNWVPFIRSLLCDSLGARENTYIWIC